MVYSIFSFRPEGFRQRQAAQGHAGTGARRFVHLTEDHGHLGFPELFLVDQGKVPLALFHRLVEGVAVADDVGFDHLPEEVVAFAGALAHAGEDGEAVMGLRNVVDELTLANTEANSDNLENIRKSENSLIKGINDFRGQSNIYKPNSTFSNEMRNLGGDYDFGNIRDAFTSFLNTTNAGTGAGDFQADEKIAEEAKKTTNKVKNEIEQNKSTGVSK